MTENQKNVCRAALHRYGAQNQVIKLLEEMAELQDAICKCSQERATDKDVVTEIADVRIALEQMALLFGESAVEKEIAYKVERLNKRLCDE